MGWGVRPRFGGLASHAVCTASAVIFMSAGAAGAAECSSRPDVLGVSRTLEVRAADGPAGRVSYKKTLDLKDREVVLTFDDGPMARRTPAVLKALAAECVKATFFVVGSMAAANPKLLREIADRGHTIGTHTWSHAYLTRRRSAAIRHEQIGGAVQAVHALLTPEQRKRFSPFFRFPGLARSQALDAFVARNGLISLSIDIDSDDWRRISSKEVLRRTIRRLEARGKGIVLMHDIQSRSVKVLPAFLRELKVRGFRIVHLKGVQGEADKAVAALGNSGSRRMQVAVAKARRMLGDDKPAGPVLAKAAPAIAKAVEVASVKALVSSPRTEPEWLGLRLRGSI
ncbi:MAG: polysaccharide deacetylase family protein [Beijerinckiaceae bacterium]